MYGRNEDASDCTDQGYEVLRAIGSGQFGRTYLVRRLDNGELRAAKRVDTSNLENEDALAAAREPGLLTLFARCPYIVKLYEHFITKEGYLNIIMEYCQGGDMARCLHSMRRMGQRFTEPEIIVMLRQILEALVFMHDSFVMHRDVKPSNILIGGDGNLKVADLGVSRQLEATLQRAKTTVGTPQYMPPEIVMGRPYGFPGDMWSLGCVLYEMMTLQPAFEGVPLAVAVRIISRGPNVPIGPEWSAPLRGIVMRLLAKLPGKRPQARDLLQGPYLNAMPDPLGQCLAWDTPDRALDRVEERDEDRASQGALPGDTSPVGGSTHSEHSLTTRPELIPPSAVTECEVILWRFTRALKCAEVGWLRALLGNEPTLWEDLTRRAEEVTLNVDSTPSSQTDCVRDMIVGILDEEEDAELWLPTALTREKVWESELTTAWLAAVSQAYGAGLSDIECHKVVSTIAQVTGENVPSLKSFKPFYSASGKLTAKYRAALHDLQDERSVLNEVAASIEQMYRRICERVYENSAFLRSLEEDCCCPFPDSDGGVPEEFVRTTMENRMTERDVKDFILLSFKTRNGNIQWQRTTSEMTNHSALPVALTQDRLPEVSTKIALLQSKSPEPVVSTAVVDPPASTTMISNHDVSASYSSSKHSERVHKSSSVVHSELRSEVLSESGGGSGGIRPSCGGSADFSVGGGLGLCENCLHMSAKVASERSHWSRELSPVSLSGTRQRKNSLFSDRGSVYTDANPEVEQASPSERTDTLSLHRFATLPVEHNPWPERPAFGHHYAPPRLPHTGTTGRTRNSHAAPGPILRTGSNHRTPAPGRKKKSSLRGRPDVGVRTSRNGPGLRNISTQELAQCPTYQSGRTSSDRNVYTHFVFPSDSAVHPEPVSYYMDASRIAMETVVGLMAEALCSHEHTIELLILLYGEPYVTESRLRESIRGLIMEIEKNLDHQGQVLHRLKSPPVGIHENAAILQQKFYTTYLKAIRHHSGVKCELERLLSKSEGRDAWGSTLHSRSNGTRHNHQMLSPVSSASNVDRLGSLFDRTETLLVYSAMELGSFTKQMSNLMQETRMDNHGVTVCLEIVSLLELRNTALHKVLDPPFGGMDGGSGMCLEEEYESSSLLNTCQRIRRYCESLDKRALGDEAVVLCPRRKGGAPLSSGLMDDRLPRHQSQISPRQREARWRDFLSRDSSQALARCTTDYGVNSHRHRDRHPPQSMRSGFVSFVPDDGPPYMRRRFTSGSDHVRAIDEWTENGLRCECFRH